jgi:hypothetical protein
MRKHSRVRVRRGFFVDVKTIGAALTSRSDTLASLAEFLGVKSRKMATEEHGRRLAADYIEYAVNDTQVTWECFAELAQRYAAHQLTRTPLHRIASEAGLGKAYLSEMGIESWRLVQPDFPPELTDIVMQSYFGGRSEVRLRRGVRQVLYCDFLSMYPTVCTLMGLWPWVIAKGIDCRETTDQTREFLDRVTIVDLQTPDIWRKLHTLVQIAPDDDILPVRAQYGGEAQYTIGLNHLTSDQPHWYTLADCISAKILGGKSPRLIKALTFEPRDIQAGLRPIEIGGNPDFRVDPREDDFFKRVIELRAPVKAAMKTCEPSELEALDSQQLALKILANSTSYGIFMEMSVEALAEPTPALSYTEDGRSSSISIRQAEQPGRYFHPLLATLITAAARLMLGIAEQLAIKVGLDWAICDTDSMAFAKPPEMTNAEFYGRVDGIRAWFGALNPYDNAGDLLKLEDANFALSGGKATAGLLPLFVFAISAKRYSLFNIDETGQPIVRKASAHGLGHLMAPYGGDGAPASIPRPATSLKAIGVERWQHDVWYRFVEATLNCHPDQPQLDDLPGFDRPAASRYGATTPPLLGWFARYNDEKDYSVQVRPFNFLTAFQARRALPAIWDITERQTLLRKPSRKQIDLPRPIAPFDTDPARAADQSFDRLTGDPISADGLKTYAETLAQYHLHPESKFGNADYLDSGSTERRHIRVTGVRRIGKEANRWEEQFYLGYDPEAQIEYGMAEASTAFVHARICAASRVHGQRALARASGVSRERLRLFIAGKTKLRERNVARVLGAISHLTNTGYR